MDATHSGVPTAVLDALRVRLSQLIHSLSVLQKDVMAVRLPHWPALLKQFKITLLQLGSVTSALRDYAEPLQRTVAFPAPTFPVRTHALLLTTLLRKKNLPDIEAWIDRGLEAAGEGGAEALDDEFCQWAWEHVEETTQINVTPVRFEQDAPGTEWSLETAIAYTLGKKQPATKEN